MRIAIKPSGRWWNNDYSWWRKIWYSVYIWLAKNAPSCLLVIYKRSRNTRQPWPCTKQYIPKRALLGWDIGGALSAFDAAFLLGSPTGQRAWSDVGIHLVLRLTIVWNATAGFLYFVKQDLRPAMEPGVWQHDSREYVQLLGFIRWLMWILVWLWGGGVLIACFLARWNRDRLWSLPSSWRRREGNNSYTGWRKFFPLYGPRGWLKIWNRCPIQ